MPVNVYLEDASFDESRELLLVTAELIRTLMANEIQAWNDTMAELIASTHDVDEQRFYMRMIL